ncbi:MAG: ribonuclease HI [Acidobacteria bacterium]|nr:ribonuclease HI [Acidobacteriota bacterium]
MSPLDQVTIYTDGGADPNPGPGGWGAVLLHAESRKTRELSGGHPDTTNNRMELTAAIESLESLTRPCSVALHTDSQYLRKGISQWLAGWKAKGWRKKDGSPVLNTDLWKRLEAATHRHRITWHWVKGHAGNRHNERADELATAAIRKQSRPGGTPRLATAAAPASSPASAAAAAPPEVEVFLKVSGSAKGRWAALLRRGEDEEVTEGAHPGASANQLDLLALEEVLRKFPPKTCVAVHTGSDYLRNGATQWLEGWRRRGWKTASRDPVKNAAEWRRLASQLDRLHVTWPRSKDEEVPEWKALAKHLKKATK